MKIRTKEMILVALFAALMAIGAMIKILFPLVPFSLQPFFCAFSGIILGSRLGLLSQIVYVALGLAGVPIFTQGGGITYIFKPSFGYLLGFIVGAYVIGKVSEALKEMTLANCLISVLSGLVVIYLIGVPYIYLIANFYLKNPMTMWAAISTGCLPFVLKDLVLYVVVAITASKVVPVLRRASLGVR